VIIVSTSLRDVAGLLRSSEKNTLTLCPLIPPAALVALAQALYVASSPTKLEAYGPVQLQINPTFMVDTVETGVVPQLESRRLTTQTLSIETKSESLRTIAVSPLNLDHWMSLDSIPK
jgi:hypothetical protein